MMSTDGALTTNSGESHGETLRIILYMFIRMWVVRYDNNTFVKLGLPKVVGSRYL